MKVRKREGEKGTKKKGERFWISMMVECSVV